MWGITLRANEIFVCEELLNSYIVSWLVGWLVSTLSLQQWECFSLHPAEFCGPLTALWFTISTFRQVTLRIFHNPGTAPYLLLTFHTIQSKIQKFSQLSTGAALNSSYWRHCVPSKRRKAITYGRLHITEDTNFQTPMCRRKLLLYPEESAVLSQRTGKEPANNPRHMWTNKMALSLNSVAWGLWAPSKSCDFHCGTQRALLIGWHSGNTITRHSPRLST